MGVRSLELAVYRCVDTGGGTPYALSSSSPHLDFTLMPLSNPLPVLPSLSLSLSLSVASTNAPNYNRIDVRIGTVCRLYIRSLPMYFTHLLTRLSQPFWEKLVMRSGC